MLGLEEAVTMALDHNRLVQNSTLDVAKSGNQLASAKTQRLPQLQLSVTPAYLAAPIDVKFDQGTLGTFPSTGPIPAQDTTIRTNPGFLASVTASVTQPIAQLYKIGLSIDQLGVARDMSRQDLRTQRQSIMNNVRQAYYAILQSQSALEALRTGNRTPAISSLWIWPEYPPLLAVQLRPARSLARGGCARLFPAPAGRRHVVGRLVKDCDAHHLSPSRRLRSC